MKAYKFDDNGPISVLKVLAQFKRAYDSNEIFGSTILCEMLNFMKDEPHQIGLLKRLREKTRWLYILFQMLERSGS